MQGLKPSVLGTYFGTTKSRAAKDGERVGLDRLRKNPPTEGQGLPVPPAVSSWWPSGPGAFPILAAAIFEENRTSAAQAAQLTRLYGTGKPVPFRPLLFSAACSAPAMSDPAGERLSSSIYQNEKEECRGWAT